MCLLSSTCLTMDVVMTTMGQNCTVIYNAPLCGPSMAALSFEKSSYFCLFIQNTLNDTYLVQEIPHVACSWSWMCHMLQLVTSLTSRWHQCSKFSYAYLCEEMVSCRNGITNGIFGHITALNISILIIFYLLHILTYLLLPCEITFTNVLKLVQDGDFSIEGMDSRKTSPTPTSLQFCTNAGKIFC